MRWSRSRCRSRSSGLIVGRMRRELHIQHPLSLTTHTQWWWWRAVQSNLEFCYNSRVPDHKNIWHHNWNALGGHRHSRKNLFTIFWAKSPSPCLWAVGFTSISIFITFVHNSAGTKSRHKQNGLLLAGYEWVKGLFCYPYNEISSSQITRKSGHRYTSLTCINWISCIGATSVHMTKHL